MPEGNGTFRLDLPTGNTGGVRTDMGQVTDPGALTGNDYSIGFAEVAGVMQYTVTNTTTATPVAGQVGVPYTAGSAIEFDGMSFVMQGQPDSGDSVELRPVTAPTDLFQVMQNAVDALRGASTGQTAQLTQAIGRSLTELDAGHDRVLLARAQAGEWLNRGEAVDGQLSDRMVAHESEKSRLEDLDMIKGISDFQNQQVGLQAALQSYAQVQRLSLFQYLG